MTSRYSFPSLDPILKCKWNLCKFECDDDKKFLIHLDFHAYHTRLKTFGLGLSNTISIPHCQNNSKLRNNIPLLNSEYVCYWSGCGEAYLKFHDYLEHVEYHLTSDYETGVCSTRHSRPNLTDIKVECKWDDCGMHSYRGFIWNICLTHSYLLFIVTGQTVPNIFQLKRHVRVHTKEKMIGCANCGKLFVSKPQYLDHCIRQVENRKF